MLAKLHFMVSESRLAVPEIYKKLVTSLRTAYVKGLDLDKEATSYDDVLDALRLSLKPYHIK